MDAMPGGVLGGRYEVGALVGLGGTARVFRARDQVDDVTVAVKIFPAGTAATPGPGNGHREGLHRDGSRELAALGGTAHAGLVGLRDSGVDDEGHPFVVMDFVDGQSLAARLRDGALPAAAVTAMGATLAAALAHVHARGVVHRDVKPGNVLLDRDGRARLTDFGIARFVDATRVTATGLVVGTAAYMAPEQVRGEVVEPPADVYALGLVLLEAVTGRREFTGGALEAAIARLHRSPVVPATVPEPLATQIRRMTAADPDERPAASDVATALRRTPVRPRPLEGLLARRFVAAGAIASLAASVVAATVLLAGTDVSATAAEEPPLVVAAPEPAAGPPTTTTTTAAAPADEPLAVAPTTSRRAGPVPVALARPTAVARPVTIPQRPVTTTRSADPADDRPRDRDDRKKNDEGRGTPVDDPTDGTDTPGPPADGTGGDSGKDSDDGKRGDGKRGDGKRGDGKGGDGKSGDGKSGDGKSGKGAKGDGGGSSGGNRGSRGDDSGRGDSGDD